MMIHSKACVNCPSMHPSSPDPESYDIKNLWSRDEQLKTLFPCAWRPEKLCKGYCDYLDVTEQEIEK